MQAAALCAAAALLLLAAAAATATCAAGAHGRAAGCRKHVAKVTEYGAVGDGRRLNTAAFARAVADLSGRARDGGGGGAALVVPPGRWLTGPFNLTSHFTLYLDEGAEILASQVQERIAAISSLAPSPLPSPPSRDDYGTPRLDLAERGCRPARRRALMARV
jgi:polygalacturonase